MHLSKEEKKDIFSKYGNSPEDTGTTEAQLAMFTKRIQHLTEHLKKNKKDTHTERSLVLLVGKRKRLLKYLQNKNIERYRKIISELGLRK
tara:strand:- start:1445 stop:1714 length:270 start_codon:yes stop_codon:yes gene_type:complete